MNPLMRAPLFTGFLVASLFCSFTSVKASEKASVLWDAWYTVTAEGGVPYGYYNDRFERKGNKIAFKNQFWRREDGYINEEQVVAIASDDSALTPEFWNYHRSYRSTTLDVDGSFKGKLLTAKVREGSQHEPTITHSVSKQTFLSVMFPVWLLKKMPELKPSRGVPVSVIYEDAVRSRFMPQSGTVRIEAPDAYAKESGTKKVSVSIEGQKSSWYVLATGEPLRIDMETRPMRVTRTTEAVARRFLMAPIPSPTPPPSSAPSR